MALTSGTRLGPYEILAPLGQGGMGEVYRAADTRLDRIVALKVLPTELAADPVRRERFEREARAVSALNHPHICALYDVGEAPNPESRPPNPETIQFLVMEYCEGESLAQRLAKRSLRFEETLRFAIEIAEAVDAAHSHGITHRDLKPANIMLTGGGVKLLDFGLAKWRAEILIDPVHATLADDDAGRGLTADGAILGTLNYMAPEQLQGKTVDERADIFALGAILYEMTTGRQAFDGKSQASVIAAILEREPPPISSSRLPHTVSPAFERVVMKCLAKDPEDRWQTARDLASELKWIAQTEPDYSNKYNVAARWTWPPVWIAAGTLISAIAVAGLVIVYAPRDPAETPAVRFEISPPDTASLSPSASLLAVSPDGRHLAFLAASSDGKRRIWIRPLDSLAARELPGTDDAVGPFWSPNSRYVAFIADGRLKKIDVFGGPPFVLWEVQGRASDRGTPGGTWNAEGTILFGNVGRLHSVSENGGAATPVTSLDESQGETDHVLPQFLPDGRHFTYQVRKGQAQTEIYLGSLDSRDRRRFLGDSAQAAYAAPGYLLFVRDGVLLAQRFDASSLQLTGETRPIADRVGYNPAGPRAMFSVSQTGVLAYRAAPELELGWFDRDGRQIGTLGVGGPHLSPALSPDGHRVAVARFDPATRTRSIWVIEPARKMASRLSYGPWDGNPVWSPDGSRIAFITQRNGDVAIYETASDGAGEEKLLLDSSGGLKDWSRDGRFVIYTLGPDGGRDLPHVLPLFGDHRPRLLWKTAFSEQGQQLSPDGQWLAFSSDESGQHEVYVRSFPDGDGKWQVSIAGGIEPRWRGDGRELFFIAADQHLMAVPVHAEGAFQLGTPTALFSTRADGSGRLGIVGRNQYVVTADGQRFLLNQPRLGAPPPPITVILNWSALLER